MISRLPKLKRIQVVVVQNPFASFGVEGEVPGGAVPPTRVSGTGMLPADGLPGFPGPIPVTSLLVFPSVPSFGFLGKLEISSGSGVEVNSSLGAGVSCRAGAFKGICVVGLAWVGVGVLEG